MLACAPVPSPTPTPGVEAFVLVERAREAMLGLDRYRYTTELTASPSGQEANRVVAEGEVTREPFAAHVRISDPQNQILQAEWVQIGATIWMYDVASGAWRREEVSTSESPLPIVDPATLWRALSVEVLATVHPLGPERVDGHATVRYRFVISDTAGFGRAVGMDSLSRAEGETWIELQTDLPLRTVLLLEGGEKTDEFVRFEIASTIHTEAGEVQITPPVEGTAEPTPAEGLSPVLQTLNGLALPLYPEQEPISGPLPSPLAALVENALALVEKPEVAVQLYTTPATPDKVKVFFETALPEAGWTVEQALPDGYVEGAYTFVVGKADISGQVVILPYDNRTLVMTTLQRR